MRIKGLKAMAQREPLMGHPMLDARQHDQHADGGAPHGEPGTYSAVEGIDGPDGVLGNAHGAHNEEEPGVGKARVHSFDVEEGDAGMHALKQEPMQQVGLHLETRLSCSCRPGNPPR